LKRKKILFLISRFPFPLIGGDKIKSFYLMKHLAKKYDVTLAAISFRSQPPKEWIEPLEKIGVKVYSIALNPIIGGIKTALRLHQKYPLEIAFYLNNEFKNLVNKLCQENNFDYGISFFLRTAEYLKDKKFKKILISEDCRVLYQTRSYKSSQNIPQRLIRIWEVFKLKKYEPEIINYFDTVTLVTNDDIQAMKQNNPNARYRLVTNGVNTEQFSPPPDDFERKDLLFTGKLSVWSNTLMAIKLTKEIMPEIIKHFPDVKLHIVVSNPVKQILEQQSKNIIVHSSVPNIEDFYKQCKIFMHPHLAATGIQNKLLEAMSSGLACVTTKTGIQGIDGIDGEHFLIANNNQEMIDYTIKLLKDDNLCKKLSKNARQLILETHTWDVVYSQIDKVLEELENE